DWAAAIPASADNAVAASSLSMVPLPWRAPSIRLLHNRSMIIALLHPGEMGAAVGACLVQHRVLWASADRSPSTHARARAANLEDAQTLERALEAAEVVLSVCPPHAAIALAREVAAKKFRGLYVDCN